MKAKQEPIGCGKSPNMTHSIGGVDGVQGAHDHSAIIGKKYPFFNGYVIFSRQKGHKSRINKRILSIFAYIINMAAGGVLGWWLVDMLGRQALPLLIAAFIITLAAGLELRLMLGGDK